ncbi:uncharacterized protein B0T15DRAFT_142763 [Chaetomium strumarium]|uniref:Uncharacterized protein n=1 Tax=Chaetomium strumarium TaxID=1170767 RepID=A0AAJ0M2B5_9PEZI|nr:hypothetical protein B0T15DRAFT_142763 [Chaetomium strumarium]
MNKALEQLSRTDEYEAIKEKAKSKMLVLNASSVVLSTSPFGDFSKMTIISKILPGSKLRRAGDEAQKLWRLFVHQPQTARCLVFLLLLGLLCQEIAKQYNIAVDHLVSIDGGRDPTKYANCSGTSVEMLGLVLWCLESSCKLSNSLDETANAVQQARQDLMVQIAEGPGRRSPALENICQEQLAAFETKYLELMAAAVRLRSRVEVSKRQGEAASAILQLNNSHISINQSATIEKLTYLTIIYLPLGLVTAIFAIPDTQEVLYSSMGRAWYIGAILIFVATTGTVAYFLKDIVNVFRSLKDAFPQQKSKVQQPALGPPPTGGGGQGKGAGTNEADTLRPTDGRDYIRHGGGVFSGGGGVVTNIEEVSKSPLQSRERVLRRHAAWWEERIARIVQRRRRTTSSSFEDDRRSVESMRAIAGGKEDV